MIINKIELNNFRIHKDTQLNFSDRINYIVGGNGQGKTSVLEAIYFLCTTKDFYSSPENEIVNFGNLVFEVSGSFKGLTDSKVNILYSLSENKKYIYLNSKQIYRAVDLIGKFPVVVLTPADHSITQGSPADRRKFVDSVISQASGTYLKLLLDYNKTLRQRSSLLGQYRETGNPNLLGELDSWTIKLIQSGTEIIKHRLNFIKEFDGYFRKSFCNVLGEIENPAIKYDYLENSVDENNIQEVFTKLLESKKNDELRRGMNLAGPHRDDFIFLINGFDLKKFGSQGQHKTFQIIMRFAQFFYLYEKLGTKPIFLMDDIFGELDSDRAVNISSYLGEIGQAFITLTDFSNFSYLRKTDYDLLINVRAGKAVYA